MTKSLSIAMAGLMLALNCPVTIFQNYHCDRISTVHKNPIAVSRIAIAVILAVSLQGIVNGFAPQSNLPNAAENLFIVESNEKFVLDSYPSPARAGDRGERLVDLKLSGRWILLAVETGERCLIEGPFIFGKIGYRDKRINRLVAIDQQTGRHKILTVNPKQVLMPIKLELINTSSSSNSVHFLLLENDKQIGSFDWSLKSDSIISRSIEANSRHRPFSTIGLEVEFSSKGNPVFTDIKTRKKLELPVEKASLQQPFNFLELVSEQNGTQVVAGMVPGRIVSIQNFDNASISWFDPNVESRQIKQLKAAEVELACKKANLTGIVPAFESIRSTQTFPLVALFKEQRSSVFWIENGSISKAVDVPLANDWERLVMCENGHYVGIYWHSTKTAEDHYVLVNGAQESVSTPHVESLESPFSLSCVSDKGEFFFLDEAGKIKILRHAKNWRSEILTLTKDKTKGSDKQNKGGQNKG